VLFFGFTHGNACGSDASYIKFLAKIGAGQAQKKIKP